SPASEEKFLRDVGVAALFDFWNFPKATLHLLLWSKKYNYFRRGSVFLEGVHISHMVSDIYNGLHLVVNFDLPLQGNSFDEPDIDVFTQRSSLKTVKGAVFNLLCCNTEKMLMEKIERCVELEVDE
nr:DEAD-box ATP-dependent RNA helicase 38 [Tanacetum cinerariifolium]GEV83367.1 DEAD-box ATP-dependent RNA helicase 38 [Tanacetum cinerariifolium]